MDNEKKQDMSSVSAPQYYYPPMMYPQDDEINLSDIWRVLVKRKKLIIAITLLITVAGSAYAILKPDIYTYSTGIQIGSFFLKGKEEPIDNAKNAAGKIKEAFIPEVLNAYYLENPGLEKNIKIDVQVPKDSEILLIESKGPEKQASIYTQLISKISNKLINNHDKKITELKSYLIEQIDNTKKGLEMLEVSETELNKRIEGFDKSFKASPIDNSGTTVLVMTELSAQITTIRRDKISLQSEIADKKSELNLIQDTKLMFPVTKSVEPSGTDKKLIIVASVIAGLIFGVFIALMWDFIEKIKSQPSSANEVDGLA